MSYGTTIVICSIIVLIFFYPYVKSELKDIDESVLYQQSSISETRKQNESAIYRSVDVPHGVSLTGGLRIQENYKVRDGCLKDIWHCALNNKKIGETILQWENSKLSLSQINYLIEEISINLKKLTNLKKIAIYSDLDNPESIISILSCFFVSELTVINYNETPNTKLHDMDLIIVDSKYVDSVINSNFFEKIIVIGGDNKKNENIIDFNSIINLSDPIKSSKIYSYAPCKDYKIFNNQPYSEIMANADDDSDNEIKFYQRSFVSSIASKLMSLPSNHSWDESDSVLIGTSPYQLCKKNLIHTILCGLLANVDKITIIPSCHLENIEKLISYDVTILSVDDNILKHMSLYNSKNFNSLQKIILNRSEALNSVGIFNTFGRLSENLGLKLIYAIQSKPLKTTLEFNNFKSLLGCRIIRETFDDSNMGPMLKTNFFDHRITHVKGLYLMGVAVNCLELKIKKECEEDQLGELCIRGLSIGKGQTVMLDDEYWLNTGIQGKFANDGCFYGRF